MAPFTLNHSPVKHFGPAKWFQTPQTLLIIQARRRERKLPLANTGAPSQWGCGITVGLFESLQSHGECAAARWMWLLADFQWSPCGDFHGWRASRRKLHRRRASARLCLMPDAQRSSAAESQRGWVSGMKAVWLWWWGFNCVSQPHTWL